jgi:hypothetical protein
LKVDLLVVKKVKWKVVPREMLTERSSADLLGMMKVGLREFLSAEQWEIQKAGLSEIRSVELKGVSLAGN